MALGNIPDIETDQEMYDKYLMTTDIAAVQAGSGMFVVVWPTADSSYAPPLLQAHA